MTYATFCKKSEKKTVFGKCTKIDEIAGQFSIYQPGIVKWHTSSDESLFKNENIGLNKREIAVIAETSRDNYSVEIKAVAGGLRQAVINMEIYKDNLT